ncbi:GRAM domain-containing protein 2A [Microcaecilia unicolor]|uniref:GRAM domain-containing protein 2A n=1 Tax=Microcaecilia unicolor TaxID=1415580 RepID=A0A6P7X0J0_9AMPH|nr:GRAM domain-containing protein 2A [Microcaecilia unicolor]XP_030043664.1 GRAM domain-containing protein 2A [Microcaecilia unicolor]XP_030043672.1 GRAM domain-containing protein 2A [Microcaecilia unicolor]
MYQSKKLEASSEAGSWNSLHSSVSLTEDPKEEENERGARELTPNKNNSLYHKLFKDLPVEENLLKAYSCALRKEILIQGRLYISRNWLCFYANLFGKDIKVVIPVVSVQLVKKHKTAGLLPNGLAISTTAGRKYIFVSLMSRDSVYEMLKTVCSHLQPSSKKSLSVREYIEEMDSVPLTEIAPEVKWRKQVLASVVPPLLDRDYECRSHRNPSIGLSTKESSFQSEKSSFSETTATTEEDPEPSFIPAELRPSEYLLLKLFVVLVCILVLSSFYLAFRIFHLEQQLIILQRNHFTRAQKRCVFSRSLH